MIGLLNNRKTLKVDAFAPYYEHVARQTAPKFKDLFAAQQKRGGRVTYAFDCDDPRQVRVFQTIMDDVLLQFGGRCCSCPVEIYYGENGLTIQFRHGHRVCYVVGLRLRLRLRKPK